jgi:hypothetical protein
MDFTTLQTEVYQQTGLDSSDATNISNVKRWINIVQQDIASRWPWPFLQAREALRTVIDLTGTAGCTLGNANITDNNFQIGSGQVGYFMQFSSGLDWYQIATTAGPNFASLDAAFVDTTGTYSYIVRKFFYSLSSSVDRILDIRNWDTPVKLIQMDYGTLDYMRPNPQATNSVVAYITYGVDSSGNTRIIPYGFPNDLRLLDVKYIKRLSDLSSGADISGIPVKWHHVIIFGACAIAFMYLRKTDFADRWANLYEKKIDDMKKENHLSLDDTDVLKPVDQSQYSNFIRLPEQFPLIT